MPKFNVNYSYYIREVGAAEIYADNAEDLKAAVEEHVTNLFADTGDEVRDINLEMYEKADA